MDEGGGGNQAGEALRLALLSQSKGAALRGGRAPEATRVPRLRAIGDSGYAPSLRPAPRPRPPGRLRVTSLKVLILDPPFPLLFVPPAKEG